MKQAPKGMSTTRRGTGTAFTLAEVLITLAIVGVIAALTLPNLISNYREKATMNKLKKFYTTMSQAQLHAINDYGDVETWDWIPEGEPNDSVKLRDFLEKYFKPYLDTVEVEHRSSSWMLVFKDGTVAQITSWSGGYLHFRFTTDYKKYTNNKSTHGKDVFMFGFKNKSENPCLLRFNAYGVCSRGIEALKNNASYGCYNKNAAVANVDCAAILMKNGWEVPDDYPYKF